MLFKVPPLKISKCNSTFFVLLEHMRTWKGIFGAWERVGGRKERRGEKGGGKGDENNKENNKFYLKHSSIIQLCCLIVK